MAAGPGLAPHRPGTSGQAGSSTPGASAVVLGWCLKEPAAGAVPHHLLKADVDGKWKS